MGNSPPCPDFLIHQMKRDKLGERGGWNDNVGIFAIEDGASRLIHHDHCPRPAWGHPDYRGSD